MSIVFHSVECGSPVDHDVKTLTPYLVLAALGYALPERVNLSTLVRALM